MPRNRRILHPLLLLLIFGLAAFPIDLTGVRAQSAGTAADEAERVREELEAERQRSRELEQQARILSQELEALRLRLVTTARTTQEREALVANLELQIEELRIEMARREQVLAARHRELAGTLSALTGLAEDAPRAFFLYPGTPLEAVRGSMLLRAAIPTLGERATILRADLSALAAVREDLSQSLDQLSREDLALEGDREQLELLIAQKRALYEEAAERSRGSSERLRELTERSETLRELLAALEEERTARERQETAEPAPALGEDATQLAALAVSPTDRPDGIRPFPNEGVITSPTVGTLVQQYGQDIGRGETAKGILIETREGTTVLSPFDGKVVFAGPFRDLGRVLIIEHDGGYHTILAGFERIDAADGHWLLAGEPIGVMPHTAFENGVGGESGRPRLYMELRREGQPVNPLRWMTTGNIRVSG